MPGIVNQKGFAHFFAEPAVMLSVLDKSAGICCGLR